MGMLKREAESTTELNAHDVHSILGPESSFTGKLTFEGTVRIDGHFSGEIHTDGNLIVGQGARIEANARVGRLVVHGEVSGDLHAAHTIEIHAPAKVRGNIAAPQVMIAKGALFEGSCRMSDLSKPSIVAEAAANITHLARSHD